VVRRQEGQTIELSNGLVRPKQDRFLTLKGFKVMGSMAKLISHSFESRDVAVIDSQANLGSCVTTPKESWKTFLGAAVRP
jgi:hypothetical protein